MGIIELIKNLFKGISSVFDYLNDQRNRKAGRDESKIEAIQEKEKRDEQGRKIDDSSSKRDDDFIL